MSRPPKSSNPASTSDFAPTSPSPSPFIPDRRITRVQTMSQGSSPHYPSPLYFTVTSEGNVDNSPSGSDSNSDQYYQQQQQQHEQQQNAKIPKGGTVEPARGKFDPSIPKILPHEQVFSIQVGDKMFRLSGASLSSDAPSFFTNFFAPFKETPEEKRPVLYLDRDSKIFEEIVRHLQGYYIGPKNAYQYVRLWTDANYYHLPRLKNQLLNSEICCYIGGTDFRITSDLFNNPGDSPNFFTLGFRTMFTGDVDIRVKKGLIRPPPLAPATITNRNPDLFREIIGILQGNEIEVKNEKHRQNLIRECRYYRFRGLEQRLIRHQVITTVGETGIYEEIVLSLVDIKPSAIERLNERCIGYKRPWIDEPLRQFVFQVQDDLIRITPDTATFLADKTQQAIQDVFSAAIGAIKGEAPSSMPLTFPAVIEEADLMVDGVEQSDRQSPCYLVKSQWRFKFHDNQIKIQLIKGVGYSTIKEQNKMRDFV